MPALGVGLADRNIRDELEGARHIWMEKPQDKHGEGRVRGKYVEELLAQYLERKRGDLKKESVQVTCRFEKPLLP